jgi:hypothetical protein
MTEASLRAIFQGMNDAKVRYLVVGGFAVNVHGFKRLTDDLDLMIQLEDRNLIAAMSVLKKLGYVPKVPVALEEFADPLKREDWVKEKHMLVFGLRSQAHQETDVDVFVNDPLGFNDAYDRASYYDLGPGLSLPVCSYEDLVKLKMLAGRSRDLDDLRRLRISRGEE